MYCRHHGTTFFPDFQHQMHVGDFMYSAFSLPHPNHDPAYYEAESGQLVIDRSLTPVCSTCNCSCMHILSLLVA